MLQSVETLNKRPSCLCTYSLYYRQSLSILTGFQSFKQKKNNER